MTLTTSAEARFSAVGAALAGAASALLGSVPNLPAGPILVAKFLKIDKATASRFLRAAACRDGLETLSLIPGPEPLRQLADAAVQKGASGEAAKAFRDAVHAFDELIRTEAGDRSGLDAMLTAWLPAARSDFELKRKQAVFRNLSQLKGKVAQVMLASAMIHPSENGEHLDIVWLQGLLGLQRLRPGVPLNFATRRISTPHGPGTTRQPRKPRTLAGEEVEGLAGLLVPEACSAPLPELSMLAAGDSMHYFVEGEAFGPRSNTDIAFAEVNRNELPRYVLLEPRRKRFVYTDVPVPSELLVFDLFIHEDVLGPTDAGLALYDTSSRGVADVNDRSRDLDRLELQESLTPLGRSTAGTRLTEAPWYGGYLSKVWQTLGWDERKMRGFRVRIEYPLYGTQVAITYDAQAKPTS